MAKVYVPSMTLRVVDRAIQCYGAAGVGQDTPLAYMWAASRTLRIADGPDEVHIMQIAKNELRKSKIFNEKYESIRNKEKMLIKSKI